MINRSPSDISTNGQVPWSQSMEHCESGESGKTSITTELRLGRTSSEEDFSPSWSYEGQRPKILGGRVALPPGKFLRVRKVFARNPWNCTWKFPDPLDNFRIGWIFSGWSGKFLDSLESFWVGWIFSRWSGKFPDSLKSFRIGWIFSGWSEKFPDSLESFWIAWKVSG